MVSTVDIASFMLISFVNFSDVKRLLGFGVRCVGFLPQQLRRMNDGVSRWLPADELKLPPMMTWVAHSFQMAAVRQAKDDVTTALERDYPPP